MNMTYLKSSLQKDGWNELEPNYHKGIQFDLVGSRRLFVTRWHILVKKIPSLSSESAKVWEKNFKLISRKSKSLFIGNCFLLCLLAEEVSQDISNSIRSDKFGLFGVIRLQDDGGRILIADESSHKVYGKIPFAPHDAKKFTRSCTKVITDAFAK